MLNTQYGRLDFSFVLFLVRNVSRIVPKIVYCIRCDLKTKCMVNESSFSLVRLKLTDYYVYIKVLMIVEYDNINMDKYDEQHSLY